MTHQPTGGEELVVAPGAAVRLARVLREGAEHLATARPGELDEPVDGLGLEELVRHTALAARHLADRLTASRSGLTRGGDGAAGLARDARETDDRLVAGLARLTRELR